MSVQLTLDDRNYQALELFTDGRFAEAARMFTIPEFRCASLLNAGDRAGLLAEPVSYDQRLFVLVSRGWCSGHVLKRIAAEGLCTEPHSLAPWIALTNKARGRLAAKRIAENLIVPSTTYRGDAPCFARDMMKIDRRILARRLEEADILLQAARDRWGPRPSFLLAEARIVGWRDRPEALRIALRLTEEFPEYLQGLSFAVDEAVHQLLSKIEVSPGDFGTVIDLCEKGLSVDPTDALFEIGRYLRLCANGKNVSALARLGWAMLRLPAGRLSLWRQLAEIRRLAGERVFHSSDAPES